MNRTRYLNKKTLPAVAIATFAFFAVFTMIFSGNKAEAAKFNDGTWSQGGAPGTTTVTFTNTGVLSPGDDIVLTFPGSATIDGAGTNIVVTGQTTPTRSNNGTDNSITLTLDTGLAGSTSITITMTDGLSAYTTTSYAQESVAINTQDNSDVLIDFGVALITNDNTTTVTASVPLFVNMAIDTTTIELGTLSTASVKEADQTYTFNSNNQSGLTIQIAADANLNDGSGNDIDYVADGTVTAGSEEYGVFIDNTTANLAIDTDYAPSDNDIINAANNIATSGNSVSSGTFDINYRASIDGNTVAGEYDQVVTVTVSTNS